MGSIISSVVCRNDFAEERVFKFTEKITPVMLGAEVENCLFASERWSLSGK